MQNVMFDELGRAITLNKRSEKVSGIECLNNNIEIIRGISSLLSTSFGPNGMDKILISGGDDVVITNDGFTILEKMEMSENPISRLILDLSRAQDEEIGDGTTGIVLLANALLQECRELLESGLHPVKIAEGLENCCARVLLHLDSIAEKIEKDPVSLKKRMVEATKVTLDSKIVRNCRDKFSEICSTAILEVCDNERRDVDFELIKVESKIGQDLSESELIKGVFINKEFSHPQMKKSVKNAKVALLTCPFEPPKIKTTHSVEISSAEEFKKLEAFEKKTFQGMIDLVKKSGANVVVCQWGFDDEANHLLMKNDLPAIRWVGGREMEMIAVHTGANIISRFEDLRPEDLGMCDIEEIESGTDSAKHIIIKSSNNEAKTVTILIRGGTEMIIEEAKRSVTDALCTARNILRSDTIIYGGGSAEISSSIKLKEDAKEDKNYEILLAFSRALEEIPMTLATNSGMDGTETVNRLIKEQKSKGKAWLGVDCNLDGKVDMKSEMIYDASEVKKQQLQMATQLVCMILKIDDVITIKKKN